MDFAQYSSFSGLLSREVFVITAISGSTADYVRAARRNPVLNRRIYIAFLKRGPAERFFGKILPFPVLQGTGEPRIAAT
jgi:hypothetical protein